MKKNNLLLIAASIGLSLLSTHLYANSLINALKDGKAYGAMRLRYESVEQPNIALDDASALTIRTRLGYTSADIHGFSTTLEFEDVRIAMGEDEYSVGPVGFNSGVYATIADPEVTELDQAFLQYQSDMFSAKLGRQMMTRNNHRFVGHVGWRQDRQTFDALSLNIQPSDDLQIVYAYISQRNRIFAEIADTKSKDHLFNLGYTMPAGKLTAYAYLLELDNNTSNALDTFGLRFSGKHTMDDNITLLYTAEFATQSSDNNNVEFDADYLLLEAGIHRGKLSATLGHESLGSDNGNFGFSTPLATLHKFNGLADMFLATPSQGLVDTYLTLGSKYNEVSIIVALHDYAADKASTTIDDIGHEINLTITQSFGEHYMIGVKYADFSAKDLLTDTEKFWLWGEIKF